MSNTNTEPETPPATIATLSAVENHYGWSVVDSNGGRWWPSESAEVEIDDSDDPAAAAVAMCWTEPMRGEWLS